MDVSTFWSLVEDAHERSRGDMERKCAELRTQLETLATEELLSFIEHFDARMDEAYSWDLWGAAFVIGRGCGDDSFLDFRSTLISCGRRLFERTLSDPDSLADNALTADPFFEGFGYVGFETYRRRTGRLPMRKADGPRKPSGVDWNDEDLPARFPKLFMRFGSDGIDKD